MADHRNRDCMFCGQQMAPDSTHPVHLHFMRHIDERPTCREQHAVYTANMHLDFKGD